MIFSELRVIALIATVSTLGLVLLGLLVQVPSGEEGEEEGGITLTPLYTVAKEPEPRRSCRVYPCIVWGEEEGGWPC